MSSTLDDELNIYVSAALVSFFTYAYSTADQHCVVATETRRVYNGGESRHPSTPGISPSSSAMSPDAREDRASACSPAVTFYSTGRCPASDLVADYRIGGGGVLR